MKIKMTTGLAGRDFSLASGEETDRFDAREAQGLIDAGIAVPIADPVHEKAVKRPAKEKRG
jgi:hypothetical protein